MPGQGGKDKTILLSDPHPACEGGYIHTVTVSVIRPVLQCKIQLHLGMHNKSVTCQLLANLSVWIDIGYLLVHCC